MEKKHGSSDVVRSGISVRAAEVAVALMVLGLGGLVVYDSVRLGFRWGTDGPEAGYFPFYIGAFICISSLITLGEVLFGKARGEHRIFVEWAPLRQVLSVLLPAAVFVLGIQVIGIYVAAAAYIAVFMVWLGNYSWIKGVLLGVVVSAAMFMMFEVWFKVPLFKGAFNPLSFIGY